MLLRAARLRARARLERRGQRDLALLAQSVRAWLAGGAPDGGGGRLYERWTDDAEVCGLACGNATRCAAACWRERARGQGRRRRRTRRRARGTAGRAHRAESASAGRRDAHPRFVHARVRALRAALRARLRRGARAGGGGGRAAGGGGGGGGGGERGDGGIRLGVGGAADAGGRRRRVRRRARGLRRPASVPFTRR